MKKLKLFAGVAAVALSLAVFVSAQTKVVSSVVTLSDIEALAGCEKSATCRDGESVSCSAGEGGTCGSGTDFFNGEKEYVVCTESNGNETKVTCGS